jgi:ribokinase
MSGFDVVGFGALNVDKLFRVNRIAAKEEESFITGFVETCGGSAANTIVSLARLGCKVGFVGKVGSDREGKKLVTDLQREGVDTNGTIHARHGRSGTVIGFVDTKGERALYVDPGVNDTIEVAEINEEYAFQTQFLHLTSFVGQKSFQTQKQFIQTLPKNVKVSLDPGELYARKGLALLEPIIRKTFLLMPNQKELELLTGVTDHRVGTKILLEKGVKILAVKLRERGCYVMDEKESHHVDAFKVKIADTTGAGDAFDAGLLYGLINGKSLYECGRIGNFVASRCIMRMGARTGLPALKDLIKHKLA